MVPRRGPGPVRLIQVHDALYHGAPGAPTPGTGATPGSLLLHGGELGRYLPGHFTHWFADVVLALWWPNDGFTVEQGMLYRSFRTYMEYVRTGEHPDHPGEAYQQLLQVEQAAGRAAALQVLREMHSLLPAGPTPDDFAVSVTRTIAAASASEEVPAP